MNKLLNLEELLYNGKQRERNKLDIFESVLTQCHDTIKRYNKEDCARECTFKVPTYIFGKPVYDVDVLVNYLIHHLTDNGLYVQYLPDIGKLYISWKNEDIDENQYLKRKSLIESRTKKIYGGDNSIRMVDNSVVNEDKYNQARQLKRQREREFRLNLQKDRIPVTSNFKDFLKTF